MNNAQTLLKLQTIKSTIAKSKVEVNRINVILADKSKNAAFSEEFESISHNISDLENKFSQIDAEKSQLQQKNRLNEAKLYSGNVVNPKELIDIEKDISLNKKRIESLETEEAGILSQLDSRTNAFSEKESEFKEFGSNQVTKFSELKFSITELSKTIAELEQHAFDLVATLSPQLLAEFDELMVTKKGLAVAVIRDDCCGVCGSDISLNVRLSARSNATITNCPSCRRILIAE